MSIFYVNFTIMTNQQNLIINELLCFIQCKTDVMDEVSLLQICESSFTEKDVDTARDVLTQLSLLRCTRKGEGRKKRSLQDFLNVIKETDIDKLPVFVAKDLHRLPPVTFDHIDATSLLKDILTLKQDVHKIKCDYVKSTDISNLREKLNRPVTNDIELHKTNSDDETNIKRKKNKKNKISSTEITSDLRVTCENTQRSLAASYSTVTASRVSRPVQARQPPPTRPAARPQLGKSTTPRASSSPNQARSISTFDDTIIDDTIIDESFTTVVNKKAKYRAIRQNNNRLGKAQLLSAKIKIVPRLSYIYISRFQVETTEADIEDFLTESGKTPCKVEKLSSYKQTAFSSFKITVHQTEESSFLSDRLWPVGVVYRKYMNKRHILSTRDTSTRTGNEHEK